MTIIRLPQHGQGGRTGASSARSVASTAGAGTWPSSSRHRLMLAARPVLAPRSDRAGLRDLSFVQAFDRSLKSSLRHVAEGACFVTIHRELLVIEHRLAKQLDLLDLIVWRSRQAFQRLRFDAIDLGFNLRDLPQCCR